MISPLNYTLWALAAVICVLLYGVKYDAQRAERAVAGLSREIASERQELRLLQAEWALRNEPKRLERLARDYLQLQPVSADQIVDLGALPLPGALEPLHAKARRRPPASHQERAQTTLATLTPPRRPLVPHGQTTSVSDTPRPVTPVPMTPLPRPGAGPSQPAMVTLPAIPVNVRSRKADDDT